MPPTQQETLQVGAKLNAMNTPKLLIAAVLSACSCSVFAQWQWVDESGRKVFSDRPPPSHISPQQVLKQPAGTPTATQRVVYPSAAITTPAAPATAAPAQADKEAQAAAKAQEQAHREQAQQDAENAAQDKALEEAKRKAEEAEQKKQQAKVRQDNCARARAAQLTLESGMRLAHINEKGERGFMTEQQRQADVQRAQKAIKDNCA